MRLEASSGYGLKLSVVLTMTWDLKDLNLLKVSCDLSDLFWPVKMLLSALPDSLREVPNNALLIFVIINSQMHYMATIAATNFIDILASILEDSRLSCHAKLKIFIHII